MKFLKEDLEFLNLYGKCSKDDIFQIKAMKDKVYFTQYSDEIKLITVLDIDNIDNNDDIFEIAFETSKFVAILKLLSKGSSINITSEEISFGNKKTSKYKLKVFDFLNQAPEKFIKVFNPDVKNTLKDLSKIDKVKTFVLKKEGLDTIGFMDGHFVSYNDLVLAVSKTSNAIKNNIFFPSIISDIIDTTKLEELEFSIVNDTNNKYYAIKFNNIYMFMPCLEDEYYKIPYIFEDDIKCLYEHPFSAKADKKDLTAALKRIKVLTKHDINNKIKLTFKENSIIFDYEGDEIASEEVNAFVDSELVDFDLIISSNFLDTIFNQFEGEFIEIFSPNDKNTIDAIKICDELQNEFFVHIVYDYNK